MGICAPFFGEDWGITDKMSSAKFVQILSASPQSSRLVLERIMEQGIRMVALFFLCLYLVHNSIR